MLSRLLAMCVALALTGTAFGQAQAPYFITQPEGVSTQVGATVTLSAVIGGDGPFTYQWRRDNVPIAGATAASYTFTARVAESNGLFPDAGVYVLYVTNSTPTTTQSHPAGIYVSKRPQSITFDLPSAVIASGSGVRLSATASSGLTVAFTLVSGAATVSGGVLTGSGEVVVRASQAGNATFAAADSVSRTITFVTGALSPFLTSPPTDVTANAGTSVTLRTAAVGTPTPALQWQKDGVALPGATTNALTLSNLTLADTARYSVTATNLLGTVSASAQVTVRAAPVFTAVPAATTVAAGDPVTLSAGVTGFPAPTFQWRKNGTAIAGATRDSLTIAAATSADAGSFDVVATNLLGAVTSPAAALTVTTRNFTGTYVGRFAGAQGQVALLVRADRTAVFLGYLPAVDRGPAATTLATTALAAPAFAVGLNGAFSVRVPTLDSAAPTVTLRGTVDDVTRTVTGTIEGLAATFEAARVSEPASPVAVAGFYSLAVVGSATGRGYALVAPDGQTLVITAGGNTPDGATGTVADGRLNATTGSGATVELTFANNTVRGTARTAAGATGTLLGAGDGLAGVEHLVNLSVRSVTAPAAPLITGFVISGTVNKQVLIRAAGPALARAPFNVPGALADPTLQLFRGSAVVAQNNDWGTPQNGVAAITAATNAAGAFPFQNGSADSAILTTLQPGAYTVQVGGGTGIVLAEVYEVRAANEAFGARRLVNLSARGLVAPDQPQIAGFVVGGTAPQRVLIRGIGPALAAAPFNVAGTLANPRLTLFRGTTAIRTNDDWFRDPEAAAIRDAALRAGAFTLGATSLDAALLVYLEPGTYTAQVSGPANANAANGTGIALVEVYEVAP